MFRKKTVPIAKNRPRILAIGGGKGGVGKTCFSVNTAVEIARRGWRVVLLDADLGCSNVETVLGMRSGKRLDTFFREPNPELLHRVLAQSPYDNLRVIPGTSGLIEMINPDHQQKSALIGSLAQLDADLVVIDLDAGLQPTTLDFFLTAETHGVLVITPERTSIDNAFKFLRAALFHRIERFYQSKEVGLLLRRMETITSFSKAIESASCFDETTRIRILQEVDAIARSFKPKVVVNKATNGYEAKIAANILTKYAREHLHIAPENLGFLYFDKCVADAVNSGVPFVIGKRRRKISGCVADIANRLGFF